MKIKLNSKSPIGVFDSGLGGLTVIKALQKILPNESFIYLGDTANVPYGNKSNTTVIKYSKKILDFFISKNTKAVVIACNTASSVAYDELKEKYDVPLFDVVRPSVDFANHISKTRKICIIGTNSTINSKAYLKTFKKIKSNCSITEIACPLLVPVIEEGWANTHIANLICKTYLHSLNKTDIDTLILGCTHYSIMSHSIKNVINKNIKMVFSGETVGIKLMEYLKKNSLINKKNKGHVNFFVTDYPQKFNELAEQFLDQKLNSIKCIKLP
jgi:glutamate racemase